jgi:hypothetical protein
MPQELRSIQKLGMNEHLTSATAVAENALSKKGFSALCPWRRRLPWQRSS